MRVVKVSKPGGLENLKVLDAASETRIRSDHGSSKGQLTKLSRLFSCDRHDSDRRWTHSDVRWSGRSARGGLRSEIFK